MKRYTAILIGFRGITESGDNLPQLLRRIAARLNAENVGAASVLVLDRKRDTAREYTREKIGDPLRETFTE